MPGLRFAPGADADALAEALDRIGDDLRRAGVPNEVANRVLIVVGELLANAAEHGATPVRFEWSAEARRVELSVEGPGPSAGAIRAATLPAAAATRGRGLFLVADLSDSLHGTPGRLALAFVPRTK